MRLFYNLDQIIHSLCERIGSGDGARKTLLTRQIASEPLPASVLFALVLAVVAVMTASGGRLVCPSTQQLKPRIHDQSPQEARTRSPIDSRSLILSP